MKISFKSRLHTALLSACVSLVCTGAVAAGMQPETSVVILNEGEGETSINVTNTDNLASLLYSTVEDIPEDTETLVVLTPPVARVEPGETQLVRVIRQDGAPSKTQRLKRVVFEGIPMRPNADGKSTVGVTVRQNLPLIIHPKGLERDREPWKLLKWSVSDGRLQLVNDSPYVVRMAQEMTLQPSGELLTLPKTYVLPGETLSVPIKGKAKDISVRIQPATVYGYAVDSYEAPIGTGSAQ
ncbi:fimbria/pilus chaperone family protein [Achromobacter sp. Root565]|uniref:fimbria/pilus chaperone family protein n=1 Tax=Achromobacter sp. Root565 TaxID=1736564 RepID=UPI0006F7ED3A|nr:fimbria/pilus chaperone family protein [Achromobacter sp. Root565]KRA01265.1 fimbrial chaperone protein [Achromobacter sp. Root565]